MTVTYRSPRLVCATQRGYLPHESEARGGIVDAEDLHTIEAVKVAGDGLLGPSQDCVAGGVPGDPQGGCHPGDRHALQGKGPQPPLHRRAGQPRPWLSQGRGVLSPHPAAVGAGEAPQAHHQLRGSPSHRYVGQAPSHEPAPGRRRPCRTGPQTRSAYDTRSPRAPP